MADAHGQPIFLLSPERARKPSLTLGLLQAQARSLELLAQGGSLSQVLTELLRAVEALSKDGMLTSILLLNEDGKKLSHCAAPSLEPAYVAAIDGTEIGPAVGSCGTAAYTRQPVMVRDIGNDPLWQDFRELALSFGLRACWSVPILSAEGQVLGTFAMYYRKSRRPAKIDWQIIYTVTRTALIAIERFSRIQQLQESEERFKALNACSPVGIFMTDADDQCVYSNPRCSEICGFSAQEALGLGWADFLHPEDRDRVLANRARARQASGAYEAEQRWVHRDGSVRWTIVRKAPVKTESGKLLGYMGTVSDRTIRHVVEERANSLSRHLDAVVAELSESEQRFRTLADNIDQIAWITDEHGRGLWFNQRWFDYAGIRIEEMEGPWRERVHHPDHHDRVVTGFQISREKGQPWEDIFPLRGKDGNYRWFLSRARPIRDDSGKIIRWFGTNTDITERILAEEALRRSEKLAIAGKLAATVSHELNNPLAAALNLIYLSAQQATDPVQRKYLSQAEQELTRVSRLANRTLSFYRGNAAKESISLVPLVQEVVSAFAPRCREKNISVSVEARGGALVHGSKDELRQVFSNLLSNAIDAVGSGGRIDIRLKERHGHVSVTTADTGHGIPEPDRKKAFEPFFTTKAAGATGLGLWITREIITGHNGTVRMKSRSEGKPGTVVSVRLPLLRISRSAGQGAA